MWTIPWQCCSAKLPKSPCCVSYFSSVSFISYFFPTHNSVYNFTKTQVSGPEPLCHCCIGDWVTEAARDDICSNYLFLWVEAQLVIIDPVIMPESSPGNKHNSIEKVLSTPQTKGRKHSTFSLQSGLTLSESIEKFAEFLLLILLSGAELFSMSQLEYCAGQCTCHSTVGDILPVIQHHHSHCCLTKIKSNLSCCSFQ